MFLNYCFIDLKTSESKVWKACSLNGLGKWIGLSCSSSLDFWLDKFSILLKIFKPERIWNCDESNFMGTFVRNVFLLEKQVQILE